MGIPGNGDMITSVTVRVGRATQSCGLTAVTFEPYATVPVR